MPQTQTTCPNCRQPVIADIEQLFDVGVDPQNKQRILSGMANHISCPNCRYEGSAAVPIVYHDPEKELLLTYFPLNWVYLLMSRKNGLDLSSIKYLTTCRLRSEKLTYCSPKPC